MLRLLILSGPRTGDALDVPPGAYLGRGGGSHVRVAEDDPQTGLVHCSFAARRGAWEVRDAGSAAGVIVNGARVAHAHLRAGDVLRLGAREYRVETSRPRSSRILDLARGRIASALETIREGRRSGPAP